MSDISGSRLPTGPRSYIKKIHLINFMCHENFQLQLSSGLNIIYGTNGSGKSTILTALMIGLGSRAKTTSRGDSLSSFIKSGQRQAWIHIKISIPVSYTLLYSKYGGEVTITRTLYGRGTSSITILDESGRKVANPNSSLVKEICSYCGIFPQNELAMLSQENAKEFLVTSTAKVKYAKLQEALNQLDIEKNELEINNYDEERNQTLQRLERRSETLNLKLKKLKDIMHSVENEQISRHKKEKLEKVLLWKNVDDLKSKLNQAEEEVNAVRNEIASNRPTDDIIVDITNSEEKMDELSEAKSTAEATVNELAPILEEKKSIAEIAEMDLESAETDKKNHKDTIEISRAQLLKLEQTHANISWEALEERRKNLEVRINTHQDKITKADQQMSEVQSSIDTLTTRINQVNAELKNSEEQRKILSDQVREKKAELENIEKGNYNNTQHSNGNSRASMNMKLQQKLRQLVDSTNGWNQRPVGPLYNYLEISKEGVKFRGAIETLTNKTLESWWVTNSQDNYRLQQLARRLNFDIVILQREDDPWNISQVFPRESNDYLRICDVLRAKNDAIMRLLVDCNHIEVWALVNGLTNGYSVADINGISRVIAFEQTGNERSFTLIESSSLKTDSTYITPFRDVRIAVQQGAIKDALKSQINDIQDEINENNTLISSLESRLQRDKRERESLVNKLNEIKSSIARWERELSEFKGELHKVQDSTQLADNESEIKELLAKIEQLENYLEGMEENIECMRLQREDSHSELLEVEKKYNDATNELNTIDIEIKSCSERLFVLENEKKQAELKINRYNHKISKKINEQSKCEQEFKAAEKEVENRVGRIDPSDTEMSEMRNMSVQEINQQIDLLNAELQRAPITEESEINRAKQDYIDTQEESRKIAQEEAVIRDANEKLTIRAHERLRNRRRVWELVKERIETNFEEILHRRHFSGRVNINDQSKTLIAEASPESEERRATSTLSGGEKSFVQIALLMSIWENMDIKLTAMDEYDVYMDKTNRSESLLALARSIHRKHMQCILITPQDIDTNIIQDIGVEFLVHKMRPAR